MQFFSIRQKCGNTFCISNFNNLTYKTGKSKEITSREKITCTVTDMWLVPTLCSKEEKRTILVALHLTDFKGNGSSLSLCEKRRYRLTQSTLGLCHEKYIFLHIVGSSASYFVARGPLKIKVKGNQGKFVT